MLANDLKKGMRVRLRGTGWLADVADNAKDNTRMCKVYGMYTEIGSVYTKDIEAVWMTDADGNDRWEKVELSPRQAKAAQQIAAFGF